MITSGEKIVRLSETQPGELVRISIREKLLYAIVLGQEGRRTILASLEALPERTIHPFHFTPASERRVISYGSDWFAEILPGPEFAVGSSAFRWASGALRLEGGEWILAIHPGPDDHEHTEVYYNLSSNQMTAMPDQEDTAPVGRWRVWRSHSAYMDPRAEALLTVEAVDMP
ncbi:hypothetical protein ACFVTJ_04175 [Agrobacterium sp. NPDC058088]|uniref:hypothetical protein n=1 Tax=Agrobacterium sp. NPDC058088 TaxID=3346335 RepID=UPI0036D7C3B8